MDTGSMKGSISLVPVLSGITHKVTWYSMKDTGPDTGNSATDLRWATCYHSITQRITVNDPESQIPRMKWK